MNDGPNDPPPAGKTATDVLNEQAVEIAALKVERDQAKDEMQTHCNQLVAGCETADIGLLTQRVPDHHRIAFIIHHATSVVIGDTTIAGDELLQLRQKVDALRVTMKDVRPLRTLRTPVP